MRYCGIDVHSNNGGAMRTGRGFKAMLAWDAEAGKVIFQFAPSKFPPHKTAASPLTQAAVASKTGAAQAATTGSAAKKAPKKVASPKAPANTAAKAPRKSVAGELTTFRLKGNSTQPLFLEQRIRR